MTDQIIDVSHHNGRIDWGQVKPNIAGAVLRMGYRGYSGGKIMIDKQFLLNEKMCKLLNIPHDFYFFPTDINQFECMQSAVWITEHLQDYENIPIKIWLDSEMSNGSHTGRSDKLSKEDRTNMLLSLRTYIKMIRPAWGVGIYASQSWFYDNLSLARLYQAKVPLWVARWGKVPDIMCEMWQYSDKGSVPGISGNVDLNRIGGV